MQTPAQGKDNEHDCGVLVAEFLLTLAITRVWHHGQEIKDENYGTLSRQLFSCLFSGKDVYSRILSMYDESTDHVSLNAMDSSIAQLIQATKTAANHLEFLTATQIHGSHPSRLSCGGARS